MNAKTAYQTYVEAASDSVEELDAEIRAEHPELDSLVQAAVERRDLMRALADVRKQTPVSQATVAARMGTSQGFVSRLERGIVDPQHSTEDRYAAAIGVKIERRIVPA